MPTSVPGIDPNREDHHQHWRAGFDQHATYREELARNMLAVYRSVTVCHDDVLAYWLGCVNGHEVARR